MDGKKLVGSAQRRLKRAFLQHGSILLDGGGERFADLCHAESEAERRIHKDRLRHSMTHLREACGRSIGFDEAAREIGRAFQKELGGTWVSESPYPANARLQV